LIFEVLSQGLWTTKKTTVDDQRALQWLQSGTIKPGGLVGAAIEHVASEGWQIRIKLSKKFDCAPGSPGDDAA
jgi:hypothetical protein